MSTTTLGKTSVFPARSSFVPPASSPKGKNSAPPASTPTTSHKTSSVNIVESVTASSAPQLLTAHCVINASTLMEVSACPAVRLYRIATPALTKPSAKAVPLPTTKMSGIILACSAQMPFPTAHSAKMRITALSASLAMASPLSSGARTALY